uniref:PPPDE domain-containing protein n=1 Tax=Mesocestoides corti TaxID=53468 RepID=A0A5K3FK36_MESCO
LGFDLRYPNASAATDVEYPSPSIKETDATEQALLTNHKPEPHLKNRLSASTTLATPLIIYHFSNVSVSGWLHCGGVTTSEGADILDHLVSANPVSLCVPMACEDDEQPTREGHE